VHGSLEKVEELVGSYSGVGCAKHSVHGAHCVQTRSLPVSRIAGKVSGGVPMERLTWYAPAPFSAIARMARAGLVVGAGARKARRRVSRCTAAE
jgi:hypothetical protein